MMSRSTAPSSAIASVDTPYGNPYLVIHFHSGGTGLGIIVDSEDALRTALYLLGRHCPLTPAAQARLHR
jgi:hypothetical protein